MKDIAPHITRQRFLIEGFVGINIDEKVIRSYFNGITDCLSLRVYGEPIIFSPSGMGKGENQGYDAFIPLIDSGISLYAWTNEKFVSIIIYTCKHFDESKAAELTQKFFSITGDVAIKSF